MIRIGKKECKPPLLCPAKSSRSTIVQRGFTITELLVVIVIMTILSAILLPALNKGRSRSQTITCLNNLRQLQLGWQMYSDDNLGLLAENNYVNGNKWGSMTMSLGGSWCPGNTKMDMSADNIQSGELFSYNHVPSIYRCPTDTSKISGSQSILRTRSYAMSGALGCSVSGQPSFLRASEFAYRSPSKIFVFVDANESSLSDAHFAIYPKSSSGFGKQKLWLDMPTDRHDSQVGTLSFADGHIERKPWKSPKVWHNWDQPTTDAGDQEDLEWLQDRMYGE